MVRQVQHRGQGPTAHRAEELSDGSLQLYVQRKLEIEDEYILESTDDEEDDSSDDGDGDDGGNNQPAAQCLRPSADRSNRPASGLDIAHCDGGNGVNKLLVDAAIGDAVTIALNAQRMSSTDQS